MITIFENLILIYKLSIQMQISLMIGNLYSADLITCVSSEKGRMKKQKKVHDFSKKSYRMKENGDNNSNDNNYLFILSLHGKNN